MEHVIEVQKPAYKIYKDKAIGVGALLGGPLVAGYLIAENFKAFKDPDKAKKAWIYATIACILIFGGIFLIPENIKIPNQVIPITYTLIAYYLVQHFQGQNIITHLNSGGEFFSWWRTIAIGLIGLVITLTVVLGVAFLGA